MAKKAGITCITSPRARGVEKKGRRLLESYKEWLDILGYSKHTVNSLPSQLQLFFFHLKTENITDLNQVPKETIYRYYETLKQRKSKHTGELLKPATLNGYIRNLNLFNDYLEETGQGSMQIDIRYEPKQEVKREVLTLYEIDQIYNACSETYTGLRERAILSLYYGCGLRSKEGINLNVDDVLLDKQLVHIRKAKNRKARYVPFVESQKNDFELYLQHCRSSIATTKETSFLLNNKGKRISSTAVTNTLKTLLERTENEELQERKIGLHTLRHSIATHLLHSGMDIAAISQFLGHNGIRSTQTYLHLTYGV